MGWLRRLFSRERLEADLDKELRFHFEYQVADKVRSGIPESEARRRTRMPKPCPFINTNLPLCSVIRPTNTTGAATGALKFLTAMGLFIGQSPAFFTDLTGLAAAADAAQRGV